MAHDQCNGDHHVKQKIEHNLQGIQQYAAAKRAAQAMYYATMNGPDDSQKKPVHLRLGNTRRIFRRAPVINPNNVIIKNKRVLLYNNDYRQLTMLQRKLKNGTPKSVQYRMEQLRPQSNGSQKLFLRRKRGNVQPTNYKIQVRNSRFLDGKLQGFVRHNIQAQLNRQLQMEIKAIQMEDRNPPQIIDPVPIHLVGFGATQNSLHDRFSRLS